MTANEAVFDGSPLQARCGERLPPVHPKLLKTVDIDSVPPLAKVLLLTLNFAGCAESTVPGIVRGTTRDTQEITANTRCAGAH